MRFWVCVDFDEGNFVATELTGEDLRCMPKALPKNLGRDHMFHEALLYVAVCRTHTWLQSIAQFSPAPSIAPYFLSRPDSPRRSASGELSAGLFRQHRLSLIHFCGISAFSIPLIICCVVHLFQIGSPAAETKPTDGGSDWKAFFDTALHSGTINVCRMLIWARKIKSVYSV